MKFSTIAFQLQAQISVSAWQKRILCRVERRKLGVEHRNRWQRRRIVGDSHVHEAVLIDRKGPRGQPTVGNPLLDP